MGPPSYMQSIVNRDVVIQHMPVIVALSGRERRLKHVIGNMINECMIISSVVLIGKSINEHWSNKYNGTMLPPYKLHTKHEILSRSIARWM